MLLHNLELLTTLDFSTPMVGNREDGIFETKSARAHRNFPRPTWHVRLHVGSFGNHFGPLPFSVAPLVEPLLLRTLLIATTLIAVVLYFSR